MLSALCVGEEDSSDGRGTCMCRVGLTALGKNCVERVEPPRRAGFMAQAGEPRIGTVVAQAGEPRIGTVAGVSPFNGNECIGSHEAYPTRVQTPGSWLGQGVFTGVNFNRVGSPPCPTHDCILNNWAPNWVDFSNTARVYTSGDTTRCMRADPWTTYSNSNGLVYTALNFPKVTGSGFNECGNPTCLGIAATTVANLPSNTWTFPVKCTGTWDAVDGPAIYFDPGGTVLAAAARVGNGASGLIFGNCGAAAPGTSGCATTATITLASAISGHPSVTVNPLSHNVIFAYATTDNAITGKIYTPNGTLVKTLNIAANRPYVNNSGCTDGQVRICSGCTNGTQCSRLLRRPHLATKWDSATSKLYLYAAFDESCNGRYKAQLVIMNITNEAAPFVVKNMGSSPCTSQFNDFNSVITANGGSNTFGWFFYRQQGDNACTTSYGGFWATNPLFNTPFFNVTLSDGTFPTVSYKVTQGDYTGVVPDGMAFGGLYATWAQAVPTTASSCIPCQGSQMALRAMANTISPP